ncbi:pyridoxal-phosphate-dependent aminotransferase family protein [Geosporobacter ferrireducens]|uniref:Class V aminotransferase n=1 Tax=Geosporobacter ferrireducens TaxID=1424294 RepID=A0A1D8GHJ4_9FIRM|nr:alanine--glyoxylate aminotransferase family protein [Geosporobacter ferrireducens]AOT70391.1 class V aminotransferase [Geosporobacter ferrireducens]
MQMILMTPGPTNVPERVLEKMKNTQCHHRTKEFGKIFGELNEGLKYVFQTKNPVLTFPAAGTGGLEAAIVNLFSPGDRVLAVSIGVFGDRFIEIGRTFGLQIDVLEVPRGRGVTVEEIQGALRDEHIALILTHNETSTGAVNPIKEIGEFMKDKSQIYIVDAVSSLGGSEIRMDNWHIDVLITASQKALMSPPGLTFIGVSDKAWEQVEKAKLPRFYWDFKKARRDMEKATPQNPYTPAVALIGAANEAIKMMQEEGLEAVFERHKKLAAYFRKEVEKLGLPLYTDENYLSDTITAIATVKGEEIKKIMETQYGIVIAGGQDQLKGTMIRVGHMGYVDQDMIDRTLTALKGAIEEVC